MNAAILDYCATDAKYAAISSPPLFSLNDILERPLPPLSDTNPEGSATNCAIFSSSQTMPASPRPVKADEYLKSALATARPTTPYKFGPVLPPFWITSPLSATIMWQDLHFLKSFSPLSASPSAKTGIASNVRTATPESSFMLVSFFLPTDKLVSLRGFANAQTSQMPICHYPLGSNTVSNAVFRAVSTSSIVTGKPKSTKLVTPKVEIPQGTIPSK